MKLHRTLCLAVLAILALCAQGCGKKAATDATQPLQQSFKAAEPEVQQAVAKVNKQLKAGQYAEATRTLAPVVSGRPLSQEQKQAVGVALRQINQSIAANPKLDTKEMYEMRAKMFRAVHDPNKRF
jgi:Flp pilus assembly protein TadD